MASAAGGPAIVNRSDDLAPLPSARADRLRAYLREKWRRPWEPAYCRPYAIRQSTEYPSPPTALATFLRFQDQNWAKRAPRLPDASAAAAAARVPRRRA